MLVNSVDSGEIVALAGDRHIQRDIKDSIISKQQAVAGMSMGGRTNQAVVDDEYVTELRDADCLLGRGTGPNNHQGNIEFRDAVNDLKRAYVATASRKTKKRLVQEAVQSVQQVKNGRFLSKLSKSELKRLKLSQPKRYERIMENASKESMTTNKDSNDTGKATAPGVIAVYKIVPDEVAMEKTKQALRYICYKKDSRSGDSVHSHDADEGDDKSVDSSEAEVVDKKAKEKLTKKTASNKKDDGDDTPKKADKKRKKEATLSSHSNTSSSSPLASTYAKSKSSTMKKTLDGGKVSGSIGAYLASPRHKRQRQSPNVAGQSYGMLPGVASPEALFAVNPSAAALPPSLAAAMAAGNPLGMLENTEQLIASALASTTAAPAASGLGLPPISAGSLLYDPRMAIASSLLASRSLPWTQANAAAPSAAALDREILLAAAFRQQQDQSRLAALQQHFMG